MDSRSTNPVLNFQDLFMLGLEEAYKVPLHNHCIFDINTEIDVNILNKALIHLLDRYPILRMKPQKQFSFRCFAFVSRDIVDIDENIISFSDLSNRFNEEKYNKVFNDFINSNIRIWEEMPLKILLVKRKSNEYTLMLKFHHHATDGIGSICFINSLIDEYNRLLVGKTSLLCSGQPDKGIFFFIPHRKLFSKHLLLMNFFDILIRCFRGILFKPMRLTNRKISNRGYVNIIHRIIDLEDLIKLREKLRLHQVSMSNYLIASLIMAIDKWNLNRDKRTKKISLEVPINLRPKANFYSWVGNWCSSVSISTSPDNRKDFNKLIEFMNSKVRFINENGLAYTLVYMSWGVRFLPFRIIKLLSRLPFGTGIDTTVFSFLGEIVRFDQSIKQYPANENCIKEITSCIAFGPICFKTGNSMFIYFVNDNMNIVFAHRDDFLSVEEAEEIMNLMMVYLQA